MIIGQEPAFEKKGQKITICEEKNKKNAIDKTK